MRRFSIVTKIAFGITIIVVAFFGLLLLTLVHGEPIHDINHWLLQRRFDAGRIVHPNGSVLLEKKSYLGGPSFHGDSLCINAVGEVRSTSLSKQDVKKAYKDKSIQFGNETLPLRILFADEYDGPYTLPYTDWQDALMQTHSLDKQYIVYVSLERPVLFYDGRCDD